MVMQETVVVTDVQLSLTERGNLQRLEGIIERGLSTFNDVGAALSVIRDSRLYRESHKTFEDYCRDRWGMSKSYATQVIQATKVRENLVAIATVLPATESQARPLVGLQPEIQQKVWQQAVATAPNGNVTAAHVERTVAVVHGDAAHRAGRAKQELDAAGDLPDTVTLRVARVVYLLTMGRHMSLSEISEKTGLTENGAWRLMSRLAGGHHVPVAPDDEGKWCISKTNARDWAY